MGLLQSMGSAKIGHDVATKPPSPSVTTPRKLQSMGQAAVHGVAKIGHDVATKPPSSSVITPRKPSLTITCLPKGQSQAELKASFLVSHGPFAYLCN